MKFKTIVIAILLYLLAVTLFSCRLTKQERQEKRDSELLEKIKGRSPSLFAEKSDTVTRVDTFKIGIELEKDYERVRSLLDEYVALDKARKNNFDSVIDLEQKALRQQIILSRQLDIEKELRRGAFDKTERPFKGDHYNLRVLFDPKSKEEVSLSGTISHQIINNETTITQKTFVFKPPTTIQAIKKLWPYFLVAILICIGAIIKLIMG